MHLYSLPALLTLALCFAVETTTALPRRSPTTNIFSALFLSSGNNHENDRFFSESTRTSVSPQQQQQQQHLHLPFLSRFWILGPPTTSTSTSSSSLHDHDHDHDQRPGPLANAAASAASSSSSPPYPLDQEPNYSRICNLGVRMSPYIEDAAELAYAQCVGGVVRRHNVDIIALNLSGDVGEGRRWEEEELECVACEGGTWNALRGEMNR